MPFTGAATTAPPAIPAADVFAYVLLDLVIILIAAQLVGQLFVRLKQPRVVGEIVAGILIGPTVLGGQVAAAAIPGHPAVNGTGIVNALYPLAAFTFLNLIGQIALVFFMFLVGVELDQRLLKGKGTQILVMSVAVVAVPVLLGFIVGGLLTGRIWHAAGVSATTFSLFMGAALAVTAFPVMARILQEKGLMATQLGALGVGAAAVVTVLMFLVIAAASAAVSGSGVIGSVAVKLLLTVALLVVLLVAVRPAMAWATRGYSDTARLSPNLLGLMLVMALATGLAADRIGISALVGGFLFGLAVPHRPGLSESVVACMQDAVVLFFMPIFLAVSGLRTDLRVLAPAVVPGMLLFLACMIVGKWAAGYVAGRAIGLRSHQAHLLGVLFNCRGLLILVVALVGLQLGVITAATQAVLVIGAIITTLMTGPLVDVFVREERVPADADRRTSGVAILTR